MITTAVIYNTRVAASVVAAVLLITTAWIFMDSSMVIGEYEVSHRPSHSSQVASITLPGIEHKQYVALSRQQAEHVDAGDWVIVHRQARLLRGTTVYVLQSVRPFPRWMNSSWMSVAAWSSSLSEPFPGQRIILLIAGAVTLLLGVFALRAASAIVLSILLMLAGWCAASVAVIHDLPGTGTWLEIVASIAGAISGLVLGSAHRSVWGYVIQRIGMMVLLLLLSPAIALQFGWPTYLTLIIALAGSLVTPLVGLWLIGGFAIAAGIDGSSMVGNLILGVAGLMVHVASGGTWLSSVVIPMRGGNRTSKNADGQIPLTDLV